MTRYVSIVVRAEVLDIVEPMAPVVSASRRWLLHRTEVFDRGLADDKLAPFLATGVADDLGECLREIRDQISGGN